MSDRDKRLTLLAAIMGSSVALLDSTVVNVALPAIRDDLGGGLAGQQWVVNAYLLLLGSLILIGGSLGDVYGARRIFVIGAYLFFFALGAFAIDEVLPVSIAVAILIVLWAAHAVLQRRAEDGSLDPLLMRARERRGF